MAAESDSWTPRKRVANGQLNSYVSHSSLHPRTTSLKRAFISACIPCIRVCLFSAHHPIMCGRPGSSPWRCARARPQVRQALWHAHSQLTSPAAALAASPLSLIVDCDAVRRMRGGVRREEGRGERGRDGRGNAERVRDGGGESARRDGGRGHKRKRGEVEERGKGGKKERKQGKDGWRKRPHQ